MQIKKVTIHNFRSILHGEFQLTDYSLLIGANNTGKSNIVDALRVFYEKDNYRFVETRDWPLIPTPDDESWIEVKYTLTDQEVENLKAEYRLPEQQLCVRKYLKTTENRKPGIYAYEDGSLSDSLFYGAKGVQQGKLGNLIYIPAVSRLEDETKLTGPSPLRDLLNEILQDLLKTSSSFAALTSEFGTFATRVKTEQTTDERSIQGLETEINQDISEWGMEFELGINPVAEADIVKSLIDYKIVDKSLNQKIDANRQGHGFQRHLIFTLIRKAAGYQTKANNSIKKDFVPNLTLILFEEPEAFLHPTQQNLLCHSLKTIAKQEGNQIVVSSHSSHFVSQNAFEIPSIIRLCRQEARTVIGQICDESLTQMFSDNQQINEVLKDTSYAPHADDLMEDMEAIKYFMWLSPERCGMFFAGRVLLVEGPTERTLLNYLFDTGQIAMPNGGIFILDCAGKFNFHRFMNLLGSLHMPHSLLFDGDANKEPHCRVKAMIESNRNSYTRAIEMFPVDIEDFLKIEKVKHKHRKPQHVMLRLRNGDIGNEQLQDLVKLVDGLARI